MCFAERRRRDSPERAAGYADQVSVEGRQKLVGMPVVQHGNLAVEVIHVLKGHTMNDNASEARVEAQLSDNDIDVSWRSRWR